MASSSNGKRLVKHNDKFSEKSVGYILCFFSCDQTYKVFSSNSMLLPLDFSYNDVSIKDNILIKPDMDGVVLAKSLLLSDMTVYQERMVAKLEQQKSKLNVMDNSLNFLNNSDYLCEKDKSTSALPDDKDDEEECSRSGSGSGTDSDSDSDLETVAVTQLSPQLSRVSKLKSKITPVPSTVPNSDQLLSAILQQNKLLRDQLKVQKKIYLGVSKLRKDFNKKRTVAIPLVENVDPVMFGETNLAHLGNRSDDSATFAINVARHLFSDNEMVVGMLFPKRNRKDARPPLSPTRSNLFKTAIKARFGNDEIHLETAVYAVNILGNDLKRGKRKR